MIARGRTEVVSDLAKPLPTRLIAKILGIPQQDHARFLAGSDAVVAGSFAPLTRHGIALTARSGRATAAMRRYLDPLTRHRRRDPGDDLISMMAGSDGDDVLTDDEIFWSASMLIGAGKREDDELVVGAVPYARSATRPLRPAAGAPRTDSRCDRGAAAPRVTCPGVLPNCYPRLHPRREHDPGRRARSAAGRRGKPRSAPLRRPGPVQARPQPVRPPRLRGRHSLLPRHTSDPTGSQQGLHASASAGRPSSW